MALTRNGKLTGRAAVEAKRELFNELMGQTEQAAEKSKGDFIDLMDELRSLDPNGWSDWYDENVPDWNDWTKCEPVLDVLQNRITELKK